MPVEKDVSMKFLAHKRRITHRLHTPMVEDSPVVLISLDHEY
jgi:hypothetical protein